MSCEKCEMHAAKIGKMYSVYSEGITLHFDVERALQIVADGKHQIVTIPKWLAEQGVLVNQADPGHLDHVDMSDPVLYGMLPADFKNYCMEEFKKNLVDLKKAWVSVFLDGSHRAARALRDGVELKGRFLTIRETMSCMVAMEVGEKADASK